MAKIPVDRRSPPRPWLRLALPEWIDTLLEAGIVTERPHLRRRQRFTNVAAYALALSAIAHLIGNGLHDFRGLLPLHVYNAIFATVCLMLPRLHRYGGNLIANLLVLVSLAGHTFVVFALGTDSNLQAYFALAAFILFLVGVSHWRNFLLLYCLALVAMICVIAFAGENGFLIPADHAFRKNLAAQAMLSTIVLNALVVGYILFTLDFAERRVQQEFERSENLLANLLPATIADRLKAGGEQRIADRLEGVTVLFADLVEFTPAAAAASPGQVVDYLHRLVSRCDALCETLGVDKIKTIGDAYMAAGGLRGTDNGVEACGRLAFALLDAAASEKLVDRPLAMRIGIHHGPAVAGVIGDRRTSYDIWGDTVNYAARLCQRSEPGRIQVSATFRRLGRSAFEFESRGAIDVKGYGKRETFFLRGTLKP